VFAPLCFKPRTGTDATCLVQCACHAVTSGAQPPSQAGSHDSAQSFCIQYSATGIRCPHTAVCIVPYCCCSYERDDQSLAGAAWVSGAPGAAGRLAEKVASAAGFAAQVPSLCTRCQRMRLAACIATCAMPPNRQCAKWSLPANNMPTDAWFLLFLVTSAVSGDV
jgi:hypothetical protein